MPTEPATLAVPFPIAGVDEVGRGPLAGPVVAAAVVLDPHRPVDGLDDSKRLGEAERERLDALIRRRALAWCVASASVAEIDALNILQASLLAMRRAVAGLAPGTDAPPGACPGDASPAAPSPAMPSSDGLSPRRAPDAPPSDEAAARGTRCGTARTPRSSRSEPRAPGPPGPLGPPDPFEARAGIAPALVLVDGNRCPELPYPACAVVRGDARVRAIAAASILAKVARDATMRAWHAHHPEFGFARHKGYATKEHRQALARLGATGLHRRSFAPVRAALAARATDTGGAAEATREAGRGAARVAAPGAVAAVRRSAP